MEHKNLHTCCFFGHRKIDATDELINRLTKVIERLISVEKVDTFLFGSKSEYDKLCLEVVSGLKEKYPHIRRIYVRAEFPYIDKIYREYLLQKYEDTYYPERMINAGKAVYVGRNCEMIDNSNFCVIYYNEKYMPPARKKGRKELPDHKPKSGTRIAYDYAARMGTEIINVFGNGGC